MSADHRLVDRIRARADETNIAISGEDASQLAAYLGLLARWNAVINLTGFDLTRLTDPAIDRLVLEPVAAARYLNEEDRRVIDVGSGSGSPALPMKMTRRDVAFVLVESRGRKAAFLREAVRALDLDDVAIEQCRIEELAATGRYPGWADVISSRAVRLDAARRAAIAELAKPAARVLEFIGNGGAAERTEARIVNLTAGAWLRIGPISGSV